MSVDRSERYQVLDRLAEEFAARYRRGERPSVQDYADRFPDLADEIREMLPALVQMEQAEENLLGGGTPVKAVPPPHQVGDYRIIREVGRGGMGVVYEAEQISLGRRVALKILPPIIGNDTKAAQRFRREARAAANLHHTNIVPVHEVGRDGDLCYYAMQFIAGPSLDCVIEEVRRLRRIHAGEAALTEPTKSRWDRSNVHATALSLLSNRRRMSGDSSSSVGATGVAVIEGEPTEKWSTVPLPGQTEINRSDPNQRHYYTSIAQIGRQVATALAYAHARCVLHRDIKPANLLLDAAQVVWVTDFGLAKTDDEDLTNSGDLLGTLRYMAPERFSGRADPRADIYGLGVTLYELLTLRPAFQGVDRLALMTAIRERHVARPRSIDPRIPVDLETICLKCIEKEPNRRYDSAEALADDLQRFLEGRPVKARPVGWIGVLWRWARRYPEIATLLSVVAALLIVIAVGSSIAAVRLSNALSNKVQAEQNTAQQLLDALIAQADANRLSRRPGQRFESLRILQQARRLADEIGTSAAYDQRLRNLAISALSLPDLIPDRRWPGRFPNGTIMVDVDKDWKIYARTDNSGACSIRDLADDRELACLPGHGRRSFPFLSPDARHVAVWEPPNNLDLWTIAGGPQQKLWSQNGAGAPRFRPDGTWLVTSHLDGAVSVFEMPKGNLLARLKPGAQAREVYVEPHPTESLVAVCSYFHNRVSIREVPTGVERVTLNFSRGVHSVVWDQQGRRLAVACMDQIVYIYDARSWQIMHQFPFLTEGRQFAFVGSDNCLVARDWGGSITSMDPFTGRLLSQSSTKASHFTLRPSLSNSNIGPIQIGEDLSTLRFASGAECRALTWNRLQPARTLGAPAIHPNGRLLAYASANGIALWDVATGAELPPLVVDQQFRSPHFDARGRLFASNRDGTWYWPVATDLKNPHQLTFGPPQCCFDAPAEDIVLTDDGQTIMSVCPSVTYYHPFAGTWLSTVDRPQYARRFGNSLYKKAARISPDGCWLISWTQQAPGVFLWRVYDANTGHFVRDLPLEMGTAELSSFSPDGQWLVASGHSTKLWRTWGRPEEWCEVADLGPPTGVSVFSPDSRTIASCMYGGYIRILAIPSGVEIACLDAWENLNNPVFSPDGRRLIAISGLDTIVVWDLGLLSRSLDESGLSRDNWPFVRSPENECTNVPLDIRKNGQWRLNTQLADIADLSVAAFDDGVEATRRRGPILNRIGARKLARSQFEKLLQRQSADTEAAYQLALIAMDTQDWSESTKFLERASADSVLRPTVDLLLAAVRRRLAPSEKTLITEVAHAQSYCDMGFTCLDRGEWGPALVCLEEAVYYDPQHALAFRLLSRARLLAPPPWNDPIRALDEARRAIAADPSVTSPRTTVGLALLRQGRLAEARAALNEAIRLSEINTQGFNWYYLTVATATAGDKEAAQAAWKSAEAWREQNGLGSSLPRCFRIELASARQEAAAAIGANRISR